MVIKHYSHPMTLASSLIVQAVWSCLIPVCMFVCLINVNISTASVVGIFRKEFPATDINLLLVAIIINLTKVMRCHAKTCLVQRKAQPSKVKSHLEINAWRDWREQDLISECDQGLVYWIHKYYTAHIIARLKYIMLLKLPIILSRNSFNFTYYSQNYS